MILVRFGAQNDQILATLKIKARIPLFHTTYHTSPKRIKNPSHTSMRPVNPEHCRHLLRTAPVPLSWTLRQTWWSRVTNVGPVRRRAIDSSELRLTTDREGRQVGQHRSHIVAAVSSACLIARAAASGSQGRIVSSLSPGRPRADVGLSAVWSDLSAVSTTDQVGVF